MIKSQTVMAIDQGTHATRATLYDFEGTPLFEVQKEIRLNRIDDFRVEQDPVEILESARFVIKEVLNNLPDGKIPVSIGIATQRSSVVAWRKSGEALSPVLSWQDRRTINEISVYDGQKKSVKRKTGLPVSPHYGATKLKWLLTNNDRVKQANLEKDLLMGPLVSYLMYNLLDEPAHVVDHANASRTLLCNLQTGDWDDDLLHLFSINRILLPDVKSIQGRFGTIQGIPVMAVSGDQNAAVFSNAGLPENAALVNLGSGAFILKSTKKYIEHDKLLSGLIYSDGGAISYALEGTVNGCATALDWAKNQLGISGEIDVDKILTAGRTPGTGQFPVFINTVGGLGSPWWKSGHTACWNNPVADKNIALSAVIESILFLIKINIMEIQKTGEVIERLIVSGGLSRSNQLCQKLAGVCGIEVSQLNLAEATSRGIAFLAAGRPDTWTKSAMTEFKVSHNANTGLASRFDRFYKIIKEL